MARDKKINIIAGPNGAGKTTFAREYPADVNGNNESIVDTSGQDTIQFGAGISADAITLQASGQYLVLDYTASDRLVTLRSAANGYRYQFSTGETYTLAELIGRNSTTIISSTNSNGTTYQLGGTSSDSIASTTGNAILSGGRGADTLTATGGNNTYQYSLGDGTDHILDTSHANGYAALNTLVFCSGITQDQISLGLGSLMIRVGTNQLFAGNQQGLADAYTLLDAQAGSGLKGDWLDGRESKDTLQSRIASANDALFWEVA